MPDITTATNNISFPDISPSDYNTLQHWLHLTHQQLQHSAIVSPFLCNRKTNAECERWDTRSRWSWNWHIFTQGNHHQKPETVLNAKEKWTIFTPLFAGILNGCTAVRQQCSTWAGVWFYGTGYLIQSQLSTLQETKRCDFCSEVSVKQRNLGRNVSTVTWRHVAWSMCSSFSEKPATAIIMAAEHGDSVYLWNWSKYMTSHAKGK
jgi:hypothetical protein